MAISRMARLLLVALTAGLLIASSASTAESSTQHESRDDATNAAPALVAPGRAQIVLFGPYSNLARKYLWQAIFELHKKLRVGPHFLAPLDVLAASRDKLEVGLGKLEDIFAKNVTCPKSQPASECDDEKRFFLGTSVRYFPIADEPGYKTLGDALWYSEHPQELAAKLQENKAAVSPILLHDYQRASSPSSSFSVSLLPPSTRVLYMSVSPDVVPGIVKRIEQWGRVSFRALKGNPMVQLDGEQEEETSAADDFELLDPSVMRARLHREAVLREEEHGLRPLQVASRVLLEKPLGRSEASAASLLGQIGEYFTFRPSREVMEGASQTCKAYWEPTRQAQALQAWQGAFGGPMENEDDDDDDDDDDQAADRAQPLNALLMHFPVPLLGGQGGDYSAGSDQLLLPGGDTRPAIAGPSSGGGALAMSETSDASNGGAGAVTQEQEQRYALPAVAGGAQFAAKVLRKRRFVTGPRLAGKSSAAQAQLPQVAPVVPGFGSNPIPKNPLAEGRRKVMEIGEARMTKVLKKKARKRKLIKAIGEELGVPPERAAVMLAAPEGLTPELALPATVPAVKDEDGQNKEIVPGLFARSTGTPTPTPLSNPPVEVQAGFDPYAIPMEQQPSSSLPKLRGNYQKHANLLVIDHYLTKSGLLAAAALRIAAFNLNRNPKRLSRDPAAYPYAPCLPILTDLPKYVEVVGWEKEDSEAMKGRIGSYYNGFGVVRDILQNHLSMLLLATLVQEAEDWSSEGRVAMIERFNPGHLTDEEAFVRVLKGGDRPEGGAMASMNDDVIEMAMRQPPESNAAFFTEEALPWIRPKLAEGYATNAWLEASKEQRFSAVQGYIDEMARVEQICSRPLALPDNGDANNNNATTLRVPIVDNKSGINDTASWDVGLDAVHYETNIEKELDNMDRILKSRAPPGEHIPADPFTRAMRILLIKQMEKDKKRGGKGRPYPALVLVKNTTDSAVFYRKVREEKYQREMMAIMQEMQEAFRREVEKARAKGMPPPNPLFQSNANLSLDMFPYPTPQDLYGAGYASPTAAQAALTFAFDRSGTPSSYMSMQLIPGIEKDIYVKLVAGKAAGVRSAYVRHRMMQMPTYFNSDESFFDDALEGDAAAEALLKKATADDVLLYQKCLEEEKRLKEQDIVVVHEDGSIAQVEAGRLSKEKPSKCVPPISSGVAAADAATRTSERARVAAGSTGRSNEGSTANWQVTYHLQGRVILAQATVDRLKVFTNPNPTQSVHRHYLSGKRLLDWLQKENTGPAIIIAADEPHYPDFLLNRSTISTIPFLFDRLRQEEDEGLEDENANPSPPEKEEQGGFFSSFFSSSSEERKTGPRRYRDRKGADASEIAALPAWAKHHGGWFAKGWGLVGLDLRVGVAVIAPLQGALIPVGGASDHAARRDAAAPTKEVLSPTALATQEFTRRLVDIGSVPGYSSAEAYTMIIAAGLAAKTSAYNPPMEGAVVPVSSSNAQPPPQGSEGATAGTASTGELAKHSVALSLSKTLRHSEIQSTADFFVTAPEAAALWRMWQPFADAADVIVAMRSTNASYLAASGECGNARQVVKSFQPPKRFLKEYLLAQGEGEGAGEDEKAASIASLPLFANLSSSTEDEAAAGASELEEELSFGPAGLVYRQGSRPFILSGEEAEL